jgi:hypothetical protein
VLNGFNDQAFLARKCSAFALNDVILPHGPDFIFNGLAQDSVLVRANRFSRDRTPYVHTLVSKLKINSDWHAGAQRRLIETSELSCSSGAAKKRPLLIRIVKYSK